MSMHSINIYDVCLSVNNDLWEVKDNVFLRCILRYMTEYCCEDSADNVAPTLKSLLVKRFLSHFIFINY